MGFSASFNVICASVLLAVVASSPVALAQVNPPCATAAEWGCANSRSAVQTAMISGTAADVQAATKAAMVCRATALGCPVQATTHVDAPATKPTLAAITQLWRQTHATGLADHAGQCPEVGRQLGLALLGGYLARLGGEDVDLAMLARLADTYVDAQYTTRTAGSPLAFTGGIFGYLDAMEGDPCFRGGVVGSSVDRMCQQGLCVTYKAGRYMGRTFAVADYKPPAVIDLGAGYDHGLAATMIIEAAAADTDPTRRERFRNAALLAGDWAIAEPPSHNFNYTSKLVSLLALLYEWTGDAKWRTALVDKLERNTWNALLMDADGNGLVDGTNQAFAQLTATARVPGRSWDGHNALPWYHAMNAWALIDAYVAFRTRGDAALAAKTKPYMMASLDNYAAEIDQQGAVYPNVGYSQSVFALVMALWKVAAFENAPQPAWESATWALWNALTERTRRFDEGSATAVVGQYLLLLSGRRYVPLSMRAAPTSPTDGGVTPSPADAGAPDAAAGRGGAGAPGGSSGGDAGAAGGRAPMGGAGNGGNGASAAGGSAGSPGSDPAGGQAGRDEGDRPNARAGGGCAMSAPSSVGAWPFLLMGLLMAIRRRSHRQPSSAYAATKSSSATAGKTLSSKAAVPGLTIQ